MKIHFIFWTDLVCYERAQILYACKIDFRISYESYKRKKILLGCYYAIDFLWILNIGEVG